MWLELAAARAGSPKRSAKNSTKATTANGRAICTASGAALLPQGPGNNHRPPDEPAGTDRADLTSGRRHGKREQRRPYREGRPLPIGTQAAGHAPDRLGDYGDGYDLEAV